MSENFGKCRVCKGTGKIRIKMEDFLIKVKECGTCDGTGFDGNADTYQKLEEAKEVEYE